MSNRTYLVAYRILEHFLVSREARLLSHIYGVFKALLKIASSLLLCFHSRDTLTPAIELRFSYYCEQINTFSGPSRLESLVQSVCVAKALKDDSTLNPTN
jgi:hypothetical protein